MKKNITDYIILLNNTPSFEDNNAILMDNIINAGGTSPTIINKTMKPMAGTEVNTGRIMLHFRLPTRMQGEDILNMLNEGTSPPTSPISVESISSAFKIVNNGSEEEPDMQYLVIQEAQEAKFKPYMVEDEEGNTNPYLSGYYGTDPIFLT